jgi:CRP-like cAMP-binding protein
MKRLCAAKPFRLLDGPSIVKLGVRITSRELDAGEYLWRKGDAARHISVVEAGVVAMQRVTASGDAAIIALFAPGDPLCIAAAVQQIAFPADAVALTDARILSVTAGPLLRAATQQPDIAATLNRALLAHTGSLRAKIDIVSAGSVPRRIAALLLYLARRFGRAAEDGHLVIDPALTREQIAQFVNARSETVIRIMSRWAKAGWIHGTAPSVHLLRLDMLKRITREG